MNYLKFNISFKIHYQCNFGKSVYILGNIPELGNWDLNRALQLKWNNDHIWTKALTIRIPKGFIIAYKYAICDTENPDTICWEKGENRLLNFEDGTKSSIVIDDIWEYVKVRIILLNHLNNEELKKKHIALTSTTYLEDNYENDFIKMDYKDKLEVKTGRLIGYWIKNLTLPASIQSFSYKFHILDNENEEEFESERDFIREFNIRNFYNNTSNNSNSNSNNNNTDSNEYNTYHNISYRNHIKENIYVQCSFQFKNSFSLSKITESIFIGCYPQCKSDVLALKEKGIKAVLNLQTKADMVRNDIDWSKIKGFYDEAGIKIINIPIKDKDPIKLHNFTRILTDAIIVLKLLEDKFGLVYVHCTFGIVRAPTVVSLYLSIFRDYNIKDALNIVKYRRRIANPKEDVIQQINKSLTGRNIDNLKNLFNLQKTKLIEKKYRNLLYYTSHYGHNHCHHHQNCPLTSSSPSYSHHHHLPL